MALAVNALDGAAVWAWVRLMFWLVAAQAVLADGWHTLARSWRAVVGQVASGRQDVPVHVFLVERRERVSLERELRAALHGLARSNGPLPPPLRLSVIAHHSLDSRGLDTRGLDADRPAAGRCVPLRPSTSGAPTVLVELALHVDGRRLSPSEVVSQLVSCYVALTAAPAPEPPTAPGISPVQEASPGAPASTSPDPSASAIPSSSGDPLSSDNPIDPATPATPATASGPAGPIAPPVAGSATGATSAADDADAADAADHAADDPLGLLRLVTKKTAAEAPRPPLPSRDSRGRWIKHGP